MATVFTASTDALADAWQRRPGIGGWLGAVNHKAVGRRFVATALAFFAVGGIEALLLRWQLGSPDNTFLDADTYNALFTMHGTTMMFLFAVPMVEAFAIYVVPLMLGARDMPMPRLTAFGYWTYLAGGLFLYASFLPGLGTVPDGGWFAYVPLTNAEFSPGSALDFWLLGVTFVEISALVGAVELITLILRFRAPGMSIARMPLMAWATLVPAAMILVAFPPLLTGSIMLELDRSIGTRFYDPAAGGDPLLWQHLFWFFGHPEVYIMLLPALGVISSVVPVFARTRIAGYSLIAAAIIAIGFVSTGLWVHHMFTVGLPLLALSFFSAGSVFVAVPSGVQIFAWIATLWQGRPVWRPPLLFAIGFIVVFVIGGMTGVMVASVPFDAQVHDSYFVVAHFHYVILGGVVFPVFAGLYHWWPKITGRLLDERLGRWSFWLLFAGVNLTFFPLHVVGLRGMPRRVWTWPAGIGWEVSNLLATVGAFVIAAAVLVTLANLVIATRRGALAGDDPWGGNTLEWAAASPPAPYNFREIPVVASRDPLWDPPPEERFVEVVDALREPRAGRREVLATSVLDGHPDEVETLPVQSYRPLLLTGSIGLLLLGVLVKQVSVILLGVLLCGGVLVLWLWDAQDGARPVPAPRDVVGRATAWWGMAGALVALASVSATLLWTYGYLGLRAEDYVPAPPDGFALASAAASVLALSAVGSGWLHRAARLGRPLAHLRLAAALTGALGLGFLALASAAVTRLGFDPQTSAYASAFYVLLWFHGLVALVGVSGCVFLLARPAPLDAQHQVIGVNVALWWSLVALSGLLTYVTLYVMPRTG